jgi:hypothetical protein
VLRPSASSYNPLTAANPGSSSTADAAAAAALSSGTAALLSR